ncbi:MAG: hypothetical protein ACLFV8_13255 [Alphaproteobacteria bacterium]
MSTIKKSAAAVAGSAVVAVIVLALLWSVAGGAVKAYLPNQLGYSELGWVRAGTQTVWHVGMPKWAGPEGFLSALQAPFRHHKVYLEQGQKIVVTYNVHIERGQMSLSAYRTNLSRIIQGARVDDFEFIRFRHAGRHAGTFEYVAPADGIYRVNYDVRWDKESNRGAAVPMPDYEMVYDIRWRLER